MSLTRVSISSSYHPSIQANQVTDSIAGQMQALKTGGLSGAPPKKKKKAAETESSDDESNTDGEEADTSETDTDTDEE